MHFTYISSFFDFIMGIISGTINQNVAIIGRSISPLMGSCVGLYILHVVYVSMYRPHDLLVMESLKTLISLFFVTLFAFNVPFYMAHVVPFVLYAGDEIGSQLVHNTGSSTQMMDSMVNMVLDAIFKLFGSASWLDGTMFIAAFEAFFVCVGLGAFIGVSLVWILSSKLIVALLLSVGPIFICFGFFRITRDSFKSWTGVCCSYILLSIMMPVMFQIMEKAINVVMLKNTGNFEMTIAHAIFLFIILLACAFVTLQIPSLTSRLCGGLGLPEITPVQSIKSAAVRTGKVTAAAGGAMAGSMGRAASRGIERFKNSVRPG